jgi:hypothetical protein
MNSNDLFDFLQSATEEMSREYCRIQKRAAEDPGTAGDQGEENWATLLRGWLPRTYHIVTKGRILHHDGIASPQVDVLVLRPAYPPALLDKKLYLAGAVAAAFECKTTLKSNHIREAMQSAVEIQRGLPKRTGTPYKELHSTLLCGLLAHSHGWKGKNSTPIENIQDNLYQADLDFVQHPREMLDLVCVADLFTWSTCKIPWARTSAEPELSPNTAYGRALEKSLESGDRYTPIGSMIYNLLNKLAWSDQGINEIARYFGLTGHKVGNRLRVRKWDLSIFTDEVSKAILNKKLTREHRTEWSSVFS